MSDVATYAMIGSLVLGALAPRDCPAMTAPTVLDLLPGAVLCDPDTQPDPAPRDPSACHAACTRRRG